jgi:hypothetical protein
MKHQPRALVLVTLCIMEGAAVAAAATSNRVQLENELRFESEEVAPLSGWRAGGANVQLTDEHVKDGRYAARISHSSATFGGIMKSIERDFVGDTLAIRGWMRADAGEIPVNACRSPLYGRSARPSYRSRAAQSASPLESVSMAPERSGQMGSKFWSMARRSAPFQLPRGKEARSSLTGNSTRALGSS